MLHIVSLNMSVWSQASVDKLKSNLEGTRLSNPFVYAQNIFQPIPTWIIGFRVKIDLTKDILTKALNYDSSTFKERYSEFRNGWYYTCDDITITSNECESNPYSESIYDTRYRSIARFDSKDKFDTIV